MTDPDDIQGFNLSIGGHINSGWMNFACLLILSMSSSFLRDIPGPKIKSVGLPKSAAAISVSRRVHNYYWLSRVERSAKQKNFPGSSEPGKLFCGP